MSKRKLVCMALVLAALVCGMTLVGCDVDPEALTPSGLIYVRSETDNDYWVRLKDRDEVNELRAGNYIVQYRVEEEGRYTVYYCQKYENESIFDLDGRYWLSKTCYVTIDNMSTTRVNVYIP